MRTIASRLHRLEERVCALPGAADTGIDTLALIIQQQPDLASIVEHMLLRDGDADVEVPPWSRSEVTSEHAKALIDALESQSGRAIPGGTLERVVRDAAAYIGEQAGNGHLRHIGSAA